MWTKQEVADKIDHEGGPLDALMWGLKASDIEDPELSAAWAELEAMLPIIYKVEDLLPEVTDEW